MTSETGSQAGLSSETQIKIALKAMADNGGSAKMPAIYAAVQKEMQAVRGLSNLELSKPGEASLRANISRAAVRAGYVYPYDSNIDGWRITPEGKEFLKSQGIFEQATNVDTNVSVNVLSNSVRGAAFENYILGLLKEMYPNHAWYSQGVRKHNERGLDFIGSQVGNVAGNSQIVGVQVKFHADNTAPSQIEWLKFLAGCYARQVNLAVFITTGRLTSEQRREAGEARVVVIESRDEIKRIAKQYGVEEFDLFEKQSDKLMSTDLNL